MFKKNNFSDLELFKGQIVNFLKIIRKAEESFVYKHFYGEVKNVNFS